MERFTTYLPVLVSVLKQRSGFLVIGVCCLVFLGDVTTHGAITFSDNFEDGVLNTDLWVYGGERTSWNSVPGAGSWSYSNTEAGGYNQSRVWGPTSAFTYGSDAWIRTQYNFNDGQSHIVNFTWEPEPINNNATGFMIHVTDGFTPNGAGYYWATNDTPGTKNLLWNDFQTFGGRGWWHRPSPGRLDWSIKLDPSGTARMYEGPNGTGALHSVQPLNGNYPWHLRFMVSGATSFGFPPGDARLNLYDVEAASYVVPEPSTFVLWAIGALGLLAVARRKRR